jgi:uncharacterized protein (DUF488 family)
MTVGYQKRSAEELVAELVAAGVDIVLDVRETPWSHQSSFSKGPLTTLLHDAGIAYSHAWFAGNPKENRATAKSHRECLDRYAAYLDEVPDVVSMFAEVLDDCMAEGLRVCLLCYERHPDDCHRTIILNRWQEMFGGPAIVQHLAADGAPRLAE